jgi:hypothetical protein
MSSNSRIATQLSLLVYMTAVHMGELRMPRQMWYDSNSDVLIKTIEHESTSATSIKRTALHNQCPMACFEPHATQRSSKSIRHRRNKEIFHHISQSTNTTRKQSGYRIKQPVTRQTKTKTAVALRPHSRERRKGITAHNSISYSVYRRIITGWFLRTSVNPQHIYLLLRCRVDRKCAYYRNLPGDWVVSPLVTSWCMQRSRPLAVPNVDLVLQAGLSRRIPFQQTYLQTATTASFHHFPHSFTNKHICFCCAQFISKG